MAIEKELKFKVEDFSAVKKGLLKLGSQFLGIENEKNILFDTKDGYYRKNDKLVRLRVLTFDDLNNPGKVPVEKAVITFKGPQDKGNSQFKSRKEDEFETLGVTEAEEFLKDLGLEPNWIYEKKRLEYLVGKTKVDLDELPLLGKFVEIEGTDEKQMLTVAKSLGLENSTTKSYGKLAEEHFGALGKEREDLIF